MKIEYVKGDLLESPFPIAHGVNCQGVMGSGVAKQIRNKYPKAYQDYSNFVNAIKPSYKLLGDVIISRVRTKMDAPVKEIFHCFTQFDYGKDKNKVYVDYNAIRNCIITINEWYKVYPSPQPIAFPKIGAGLANGDWNIISSHLEHYSSNFYPIVYELR